MIRLLVQRSMVNYIVQPNRKIIALLYTSSTKVLLLSLEIRRTEINIVNIANWIRIILIEQSMATENFN